MTTIRRRSCRFILGLSVAAPLFFGLAAPLAEASHRRHVIIIHHGYWGPWWDPWWWGPGYYGYYGRYGYYGLRSRYTAVDTDVSPEEAEVYLNGRYIGAADDFDGFPEYLYLRRGHYRIEFRLPGYEAHSVEVDAAPGRYLKVDRKLKKIPGSKQYGSYTRPSLPGGVRRFYGKKNDRAESLEAEEFAEGGWGAEDEDRPRAHRKEPRRSEESEAREGSAAEERVGPSERSLDKQGHVSFRVEPADAAVYVDNRFAGTGTELQGLKLGLELEPGTHDIVVSRPGYESKTVRVDLAPGSSKDVVVELEKK